MQFQKTEQCAHQSAFQTLDHIDRNNKKEGHKKCNPGKQNNVRARWIHWRSLWWE